MGIAVSTVRLIYLTMYKLDLEYKLSLISTAKMSLSQSVNDLLTVGTDLEPDSPEVKALERRKERLYLIEKRLDEQMTRYQTTLKMVEAQIDQVNNSIDRGIQHAFGGRGR